ncbi:nuclear transport factor 2 family protein [Sungkyunkwania multivorans]|uniref:Nuclear transport factor 2 family protein n=1 Tax=Sungkyunkwania multivorans TaxID=1173618 RepID=A0ABW3CTZ6_9FLAO
MSKTGLALWHQFLSDRDFSKLDELIAEDAVMHSPVVWTPQKGKKIVSMYLIAAGNIIANDHFQCVREVCEGNNAFLEFKTEIDGITVEGIDMITFNDEGKLQDIKVMVRPLKAVNIVHQKMGEFLMKMKGA